MLRPDVSNATKANFAEAYAIHDYVPVCGVFFMIIYDSLGVVTDKTNVRSHSGRLMQVHAALELYFRLGAFWFLHEPVVGSESSRRAS